LKRGWTPFSGSAKAIPALGAAALIFGLIAVPVLHDSVLAFAQNPTSDPAAVKRASTSVPAGGARADSSRNDELTLAGLRPGRDVVGKAEYLFSKPSSRGDSQNWHDACRHETLSIFSDSQGTIVQITVAESAETKASSGKRDCGHASAPLPWLTGHGLVIGDSSDRVIALYGQPGTRGPSTKAGQQLELLYYAFDWAGPDVPQVMTVLCTPAKDGKPGRVVEITLAAPSL
jgi:hypothetical protein